MSDISNLVDDLYFQIMGITDSEDEEVGIFSLPDLGEVFLKMPNGKFFKLWVEEVNADMVDFIDDDDWSNA